MTRFIWVGLLGLSTLLSACSWNKNVDLAIQAVERFHLQFNAGQYDRIYFAADEKLRATTSESDFTKLVQGVHQKLGAIQRSKRRNTSVAGSGDEIRIALVYYTSFGGGAGVEQFTWRISDNRALLYHYRINVNGLIAAAQ